MKVYHKSSFGGHEYLLNRATLVNPLVAKKMEKLVPAVSVYPELYQTEILTDRKAHLWQQIGVLCFYHPMSVVFLCSQCSVCVVSS